MWRVREGSVWRRVGRVQPRTIVGGCLVGRDEVELRNTTLRKDREGTSPAPPSSRAQWEGDRVGGGRCMGPAPPLPGTRAGWRRTQSSQGEVGRWLGHRA